MMALEKPYAAKNPQAIPDEILIEMVNTCSGDREQIFTKAKQYTKENTPEILFAIYFAKKELLREHGYLEQAEGENAETLSYIKKILYSATELKNMMPEIPNFEDISKIPERSLPMRLINYMYSIEVEKINSLERYGSAETFEKLRNWDEFMYLLEYHITVFQDLQADLSSLIKRGAPNKVAMLTGFIHHVAKMYTVATGEKFKVSEYDGVSPYTKSMLFAQKGMAVLRTSDSISYTSDNFHIACKRAAAIENKLKRNKSKTL